MAKGWPNCDRAVLTIGDDDETHLGTELQLALAELSESNLLDAEIRTEKVPGLDRDAVEILVVNTSPEEVKDWTPGCTRSASSTDRKLRAICVGVAPIPFDTTERFPAYGINAGVTLDSDGWIRTVDDPTAMQERPSFWNAEDPMPDFSFDTLADDPLPSLAALVAAHDSWGSAAWSEASLQARADAEAWTDEMWLAAREGRADYETEHRRLRDGLATLASNDDLLLAFQLMNEALAHSSRGKYPGWRPFQVGFVLATAPAVADPTTDSSYADIVWFATGGGKTETYLGLVTMAALHDRITGKTEGVTAWSRFPLRLLSLQQTQRFADDAIGAELVRRRTRLEGEPFSMGF